MIPEALRAAPRWGCYRLVPRGEGKSKVPDRPTNRPELWGTIEAAEARVRSGKAHGLGFLLGDGWAGIDLDHVGLHRAYAVLVVRTFAGAYVEPSISGDGIHIIGRAPSLGFQIDFRQYPVIADEWTGARYFARGTGGEGNPTADISETVTDWLRQIGRPKVEPKKGPFKGWAGAAKATDDELLQAAGFVIPDPGPRPSFIPETAPSGAGTQAARLWKGDLSLHGGDHSRADQALVTILTWWTNGDTERVDRLFRRSGLMRPKWNTTSYRKATLGKART